MRTSEAGLNLIKRWEGFSSKVYICAAGYPTIGYGHVVLKHETFANGVTKEEATEILRKDVEIAERGVTKLIQVPLNQNQFDALVSFVFNLGSGALQRSTLRSKLNRKEYESAAKEFRKWVFAGGKKLRGLVRRREEEKELFETPIQQVHMINDNGQEF